MENLQLSPSLSVPCEHSWLWYDSVHNLLPASFTCGFTWGFPEEAHHVHTELFGTRLHACFYPRRTIAQLLWALRIRSLVLRSTAKMRQHALRSWPGKKGRQVTGFFPGLSHCVENYSCDRMQRKISSAENRSKGFFFSIAVCSLLDIDAVTLQYWYCVICDHQRSKWRHVMTGCESRIVRQQNVHIDYPYCCQLKTSDTFRVFLVSPGLQSYQDSAHEAIKIMQKCKMLNYCWQFYEIVWMWQCMKS